MTQTCKSIPSSPLKALRLRSSLDSLLEAEFFQALADETRLRLLCCLSKCARPCSLSEIAECCDVDVSVVSRHMKTLAQAGIVEKVRRGRSVLYHTHIDTVADRFSETAQAFRECCVHSGNE